MFHVGLFRIRAFSVGNLAGLLASIGRGGLQFMLIIWLQGIWLPLHGYSYESTPLWAGIYLLPLTVGFLVAGPVSGWLSDRYGARLFADRWPAGRAPRRFVGLLLLPVDFPYWLFAAHPAGQRHRLRPVLRAEHDGDHEQRPGAAARRRLRHARHVLQLRHVAVDRHLLLADDRRPGAASADTLTHGPGRAGRLRPTSPSRSAACRRWASCSPRSSGYNPIAALLGPTGALDQLPRAQRRDADRQGVLPAPDLAARSTTGWSSSSPRPRS